ncbi:30S ribosome-binding factor RbfA [Suttonella ornithocola]|uniref:Ribosome-binding factor A n=1 Tax=Suttonella ornithocola TaxID=279832 RepID=A0A380MW98_9GAMM|nr:30S ribosome-binding factor RbfA [Suttonella ornithocola]SUO96326.1 Ribosome-binding factor A [Suttonella ornithocola]
MPKGIDRTRRLGEQMRRDLAQAVSEILDHPHASLLSFTDVRVTKDLAYAKVYVTHVLDNPLERAELVQALNDHSGQFRHYLAKRMTTRKVPELTFYYDDSVEYGARMENLLDELVKDLPSDKMDDEHS